MEVSGDDIADEVLRQFDKLPRKRKPQSRSNTVREWVPMSGIVVQRAGTFECVALGTGMKCLPQSKITGAQGRVLHDWHAEMVAIRAFNAFMLDECRRLAASSKASSECVQRRRDSEISEDAPQPFSVADDVVLHMYCSEAPCGDCSMELTMAAQQDDSPWTLPVSASDGDSSNATLLNGRGYFSQLGIVRRKPSRPDAPPTLSKSCSDKLALHQCTSLLSSITCTLIHPANAYLCSLTLPSSQYSTPGCARAFSPAGRMRAVSEKIWPGGYAFRAFEMRTTSREFAFSRRSADRAAEETLVPSNLATAWTPRMEETLVGGVLQGRKQADLKGASALCRSSLWRAAREAAVGVDACAAGEALGGDTYGLVKESDVLRSRRMVKEDVRAEALKGWVRNSGDEFSLFD